MDKDNKIRAQVINLSEPEIKPYTGVRLLTTSDFIPLGADNLFPQALALFCRTSPNHRGILNSKHTYMMGDGLVSDDTKVTDLFTEVNAEGESMNQVISRIDTDYGMFGNGWFELITDKNGTFLWFSHLDSTKVRLEKGGENVIIHPDWAKDSGKYDKYRKYMSLYPNFQPDKSESGFPAYRCIYHLSKYEPEFVYYGVPQYLSSKDSIQIDLKTNKWNLARLKNSFRVSGLLFVPVKDPEEAEEVLSRIKKDFIGEDNQAKLLTIAKGRAADNEKAERAQLMETKQDDDGSWIKLHSQSVSDMIVSHGWFRSLTGIADNTGFDTQRILNEYEVALNTVINERQMLYIDILKKLYNKIIGMDLGDELKFKNRPPLETDNYKKIWELRRDKGIDFDENDPAQQQIIIPSGTTNTG